MNFDWLKILAIRPKHLFGIWLFCLILVLLPLEQLEYLALRELVQNIKSWLSLAAIGFFILWLVQLAPWEPVTNFFADRRFKKDLNNVLKNLSPDELALLAYCVDRKAQTIHLPYPHPVATALQAKGFLRIVPGNYLPRSVAYFIPNTIWNQVVADKNSLLTEQEWNDPQIQKVFDDMHLQIQENARRALFF